MKLRAPHKLAATLIAGAILTSGCTVQAAVNAGINGIVGGLMECAVSGTAESLTPDQNANAQAIITVALNRGLGQRGAELGVVTALTESTLNNVNHGDAMGPSSTGLFQQMGPWGPREVRMDPAGAAGLFFDRVVAIEGWETKSIPEVAQTVQQSEFDGHTNWPGRGVLEFAANYQQNLALGLAITANILGVAGPTCTSPGSGSVTANGPNVTIPDHPDVIPILRGKTIQAPTAQMATGLAAGFNQLGLPYVWGGGGDGAGANDGCSRGGGDLNSCQGLTGFDCSGLTAFVYVQGGMPSPGGNSGAQRAGGTDVSYDQGLPGDIVGFPGHVAIFLGNIDGKPYILEASTVGTPIHVVELRRSDKDGSLHRYWGTPA